MAPSAGRMVMQTKPAQGKVRARGIRTVPSGNRVQLLPSPADHPRCHPLLPDGRYWENIPRQFARRDAGSGQLSPSFPHVGVRDSLLANANLDIPG